MEEKEKVPSDSNGLSGEGNIENILLVEKGLRELASLKVFVHNLMLEILFIDIICLLLEIFLMEECMCKSRGGARNFCLGGPICVANLLVYTNFYIHTQTHVSIHTHKKLVSFIMNP